MLLIEFQLVSLSVCTAIVCVCVCVSLSLSLCLCLVVSPSHVFFLSLSLSLSFLFEGAGRGELWREIPPSRPSIVNAHGAYTHERTCTGLRMALPWTCLEVCAVWHSPTTLAWTCVPPNEDHMTLVEGAMRGLMTSSMKSSPADD